ncbi:CGGC domain-containing protein [Geomesophilobacter sediminis]|uniref:CGGC domain-containing protein n=1 Tax=Geomesophilobacter sediminis TaxID=2798584 RepID=A0A8J7SA48_9BACT|nr:CGGC domain-containing protein [Geomesophilobacter sediminis]MBJ6727191.1 CGGC domain-containing protein [Geomesophilobacter sediminis]
MVKIGIITCANMTNDLACSCGGCLQDSYAAQGKFARYAERGGVQVAGIISCSGCPTLRAPEKIVQRVRPLAVSGVEAIHFSYCLERNCPFKNKYRSVLQSQFPDLEFVSGTHEISDEQLAAEIDGFVKSALCQQSLSMADLMLHVAGKKGLAQEAAVVENDSADGARH